MEDIDKLKTVFKLKEVHRVGPVQNRKESSAEHSWGSMVIADYFLERSNLQKINRERVMELLLYHDLVEIEAGDTDFNDDEAQKSKKEKEKKGFVALSSKLPLLLAERYKKLHEEYENINTIESKFAHAVDKIEPVLHALNYKKDWLEKGYAEELIISKKIKYIEPFPELVEFFKQLIKYLKDNGFFKN